jgi:glucosamine--fructose-6-phosphate aminotransferase (isomerizing)
MCGIVGIVSKSRFSSDSILKALKRLDYRGYDSWGIATNKGFLYKKTGEINPGKVSESANTAIAHTRWSTHGEVTDANAHPHSDCEGNLFIAHNGIIENYAELKQELQAKSHFFRSETDSEVIAHFLEEKLKEGKDLDDALLDFQKAANGTYAVLITKRDEDKIWAVKKDSPLALGLIDGGFIVASDIYAFSDRTNEAIWMGDNEFAVISAAGCSFYDSGGKHLVKKPQMFFWPEEKAPKKFEHYMLKEIHEIPEASRRLLDSLQKEQKERLKQLVGLARKSHKVIFVASGTSYHASLLGVYFLNKAGIEAQTIVASEFRDYSFVDKKTLVIAISQSGETMDTIEALKIAKEKGTKIVSLVNVPYSTIQRMSDLSISLLAGQEVCVAATKTFISQVLILLALAKELGYPADLWKAVGELEAAFAEEEKIRALAQKLASAKDLYILGRGLSYPVSREIALKLKEISYVHAEGMMGGELKHGTLALIEPGTPVIGLVDNTEIISNLKEVEARGGEITVLSDCDTEFKGIRLSASSEPSFALAATVVGQLLTYYIAKEKGLPIDRPRNLAKCVSVR